MSVIKSKRSESEMEFTDNEYIQAARILLGEEV